MFFLIVIWNELGNDDNDLKSLDRKTFNFFLPEKKIVQKIV